MNKWLVVTLTTAVLVIAILIAICIENNNSSKSNVLINDGANDSSMTEVSILPTANITLPVGEVYNIDLSKIPNEFQSDIGVELSNECCELHSYSIKAVKIGKTVVDISYISDEKEYLSQTLNIEVVTESITFKYDIKCVDFNKYNLIVTPLECFDANLFSILYDEKSSILNSSDYNIDITITENTNLILQYANEDLFNIPLNFDVSKFKYSICIGGDKVDKNKLYFLEDAENFRYNSLSVDIQSIDGLDMSKFYLKSSLNVSGLIVYGNKIGHFEVDLFYVNEKLLTFIVEVCEPVATKIVAEDTVKLKVRECYTVKYTIFPSGYNYGVSLSASGGVIESGIFYADSAGDYTLTISSGDVYKIVNIIVEDVNQNFDLLDRQSGVVLSTNDSVLAVGDNYFIISTTLKEFRLFLNDEEIFATSDFVVINVDEIGNYILNVYNSENSLVKTYNFVYK